MKVALNPAELRLIVDALDDPMTNTKAKEGKGGGGSTISKRHLQSPIENVVVDM